MSVDVTWDAGFIAGLADGVINAAWRGGGCGGLRGGNGGSLDGLSCEREEEKDFDLSTNGLLDLKGLTDSNWVVCGLAVMMLVCESYRESYLLCTNARARSASFPVFSA